MLTVLTDGTTADRGLVNSALTGLHDRGTSVLGNLGRVYADSLSLLDRRLSAINGRRQRSRRTPLPGALASFDITDFEQVDQSHTTAAVRIDSGGVSLRELSIPQRTSVFSTDFNSDTGTVSKFGKLYQVSPSTTARVPVGTFIVTLNSPTPMSLVLLDIAATPSSPGLSVQVSTDGSIYVPATSICLEGYRISARFPPSKVKYIKLVVTPTHADNIDGGSYTFGLTDVNLSLVQFQLSSELSSRPILINPSSHNFQFVADADPGIQFYLSLSTTWIAGSIWDGSPFTQVASGDIVAIPGASVVALSGVTLPGPVLPADLYSRSLKVSDVVTGNAYRLLLGLNPAGAGSLSGKSVAVFGTTLTLVPTDVSDGSKTCNVNYTHGPAYIWISIRALFTTRDNSKTPTFRGASFQEI